MKERGVPIPHSLLYVQTDSVGIIQKEKQLETTNTLVKVSYWIQLQSLYVEGPDPPHLAHPEEDSQSTMQPE